MSLNINNNSYQLPIKDYYLFTVLMLTCMYCISLLSGNCEVTVHFNKLYCLLSITYIGVITVYTYSR